MDNDMVKIVNSLGGKIKELEKQASDLQAQVAMYEKRAQAEDILLQARKTNAPDRLKANTIDDFLSKRASLECKEDGELEKVASMVSYFDDIDDFIGLSDENSDSGYDPLDFTGNLLRKI